MRSGGRLGGGSCPKWPPGWPGTTRFGGNDDIWTPLWEAFSLKNRFFDIDFYIKFQKAFLEDFHGFRTSFS